MTEDGQEGGRELDPRDEVRAFLMSRRARITPEIAGIATFGDRRRVPGLRRDEVARLAGVSVDYFTRLERGNLRGVSEQVLDAVSDALALDEAEREHLFDLARSFGHAPPRATTACGPVRPAVQYMLDAVTDAPALVLDHRMNMVAANVLGYAMYAPMYLGAESVFSLPRPGQVVNHSKFIFLDPRALQFYPEWQQAAEINVAILRRESGKRPRDAGLLSLIGELSVHSDDFRRLWAAHNVRRHYAGTKTFRHPVVGDLELNYVTMELSGDPGLAMTIYPPTPGSATADAIRLLSAWAATGIAAAPARNEVRSDT